MDSVDQLQWPFTGYTQTNVWRTFRSAGFSIPVSGCVYPQNTLCATFPLGGLGTGYLGLAPDGKIGDYSIYNDYVPPANWGCDWLFVGSGNAREPLSAASGVVWGHFPICDRKAAFRTVPACVGVRAFSPFIPGDAKGSAVPAAAFEVLLHNTALVETAFNVTMQLPKCDKKLTSWELLLDRQATYNEDRSSAAFSVTLSAGESVSFRAVFAWYAPYWRDSGNEAHVNFYSTLFSSAAETAQKLLAGFDGILKRICAWQQVIYDGQFPIWMQDMLIQTLYSFAKNSIWLAKTRKDEWWSDEYGWFSHSESHRGCPITETIVCRMHGHFPILFFFPELEETVLRAFRHFQIEDGEIAFSFGLNTSMRDVRYHCQHPIDAGYYVQMLLQYYERTGDRAMLTCYYESLKRAVRYHYSLDDDGDGLVNDQPHVLPGETWPANQFYDIWPWWGTSAYVGGIWLATLQAGIRVAEKMGDAAFAAECAATFEKGLAAFDEKLWAGSCYRIWNNPTQNEKCDVSLGNQLMGEWCAAITGTGPVFDTDKVARALDTVWNLNVAATPFGMVNGVTFEGERFYSLQFERSRSSEVVSAGNLADSNDHSAQMFIGESFAAAMTYLWKGRKEQGMEIAKRIYETIALNSATPWDQYCIYTSDDGLPSWGQDYYSNMIQWLLPVALEETDLETYFSDPDNLVNRICRAGQ